MDDNPREMKYSAIIITACFSAASLRAEQINLVAKGDETFHLWGCSECHVSTKDDNSIKTGPSLYNLFQTQPRSIEVVDAAGKKSTVTADHDYFMSSVRKPAEQLAIAESGATKGTAYPAIMPQFPAEIIKDSDIESIWHYLRHSADEGKKGPAQVMAEKESTEVAGGIFVQPAEVLVSKRPVIVRAPLLQSSGRAIHVGLPNGMNFSFDPRFLSVRKIWSGGFLNMTKEQKGRSTPGSDLGYQSSVLLDASPLLTPLTADGKLVDFEFKEPDVLDDAAVKKHLQKGGDFLAELASWDAAFLGYDVSPKDVPSFHFRVGKNDIHQVIDFTVEGRLKIEITGKFAQSQVFQLRTAGLTDIKVQGGQIADGKWTLPAASTTKYVLEAKICDSLVARPLFPVQESFALQQVVAAPAQADLPPGYSIENWSTPLDTYGRKMLFEPTGIAVAKNGTIVVSTRTAGVWRIKNKQWQLFAEGTYESLGVVIEDDAGDVIVVSQKPELTRIRDVDGDGRADKFETVCDDYGFHGNYHEYTHGPVRDAEGNYYFNLNLCHNSDDSVSYRAGGAFMGSMGGYRGWNCRVTPAGIFEPYASGLRSPAGLGIDPNGRLMYIENQGEYAGSSKIQYITKGDYFAHPSGLVSLPGMKPGSPEIAPDLMKDKAKKCAVWLPYSKLANSPGNPTWNLTKKFGPFEGDMFVGDQTISTLLRITTEKVGNVDQGGIALFAKGLASGVMRPCYLPDGSLLIGQTGRGWQSKGGNTFSLQCIIWDGKTIPADIRKVSTESKGFTLHLTAAIKAIDPKDLKIESWTYNDSMKYGSGENEKRVDVISSVKLSADGKSVMVEIPLFATPEKIIDRIYRIQIPAAKMVFGETPSRDSLDFYQTVRAVPAAK
jgi:hypothetical protein